MVGQNIGKYRVLDRIGRGGMGTVYRAVDETLHRDVAIKVLNAELNDPEVAKRFRAEAITVARLSHPGIATIYELFQHEGQWLMVMEFVRGETLEGMVTRLGALPPQRTAELCMQVLAALAHAHSMGVVHRDLKPANIMITEAGAIKVMDFGIARVAGTEHLTSAGFMMGTPAYMAPEQVMGQEIDARADLYAMGVVFYRLTTGKLPFKGETPFAMAQSQVNDMPTPMGLFRADLPAWVEQVVVRALAKNPDQRFQSAIEFHEGFSRCLAGQPMASLYNSSAPTELLRTPPRAMPTGSIERAPLPASAVTGSQPAPEFEATMLSPTPSGRMPTGAMSEGPAVSVGVTAPSGAMPVTPVEAAPVPVPVPSAPAPGAAVPMPPAAPDVPPPAAAAPSKPAAPAKSSAASAVPGAKKSSSTGLIAAAVAVLIAGGGVAWWMSHRQAATPVADVAPAIEPAQPVVEPAPTPPAGSTPVESAPAAVAPKASAPVVAAPTRATAESAPASSPVAAPASSPIAAAAPTVEETPVSFPSAKLMVVNGRKADDVDVSVSFGSGRLELIDKKTGASRGAMAYSAATAATYFRGRDPKWDPALAGPPQNLDVGGVLRTAKHWLVLQNHEAYLLVRLDDSNWRKVLETVEARVRPVTVATEKEK